MGYRQALIRFVTFLAGLYFFLRFVLPERIGGVPDAANPAQITGGFVFGRFHEQISDGFVLVGAMAVGLGLINLLMVHGSKLLFGRKGAANSAALLLGLLAMMFVTVRDWRATNAISEETSRLLRLRDFAERIVSDRKAQAQSVPPAATRIGALISTADAEFARDQDAILSDTVGTDAVLISDARDKLKSANELLSKVKGGDHSDPVILDFGRACSALAVTVRDIKGASYDRSNTKAAYNFLNQGLFMPLGSAMFALLGFYIAAAAYRAFRIKSAESGLMMAAAVLVMLGQIPFGIWLWDGFPELRLWLLQVPNSAAARAIEIGASVAGLVMAFRMWLSIESEKFK